MTSAVEQRQERREVKLPFLPPLSVARILALVATVLLALLLVGFVSQRGLGSVHLYSGTVLRQTTPAPSMAALEYADGSPVEIAAYNDELLLVYFGYTSCPDVCPTTLALVADSVEGLSADDAERVTLMMVSVDPARDDAALVNEYAQFFHPSFVGVSGPLASIEAVATQYGIFFASDADGSGSDYFVDHTSTLLGIGADGTLRIVWPPTATAAEVRSDIEALLP